MTPEVGGDHAVVGRELVEDGLEHLATRHQTVDEQERPTSAALDEVKRASPSGTWLLRHFCRTQWDWGPMLAAYRALPPLVIRCCWIGAVARQTQGGREFLERPIRQPQLVDAAKTCRFAQRSMNAARAWMSMLTRC
jgi:hypothetical protein